MNVLGGLESAILCLARLLRVKMDFVYPQLANLMLNVRLLGMSAHQEDFQVIHSFHNSTNSPNLQNKINPFFKNTAILLADHSKMD